MDEPKKYKLTEVCIRLQEGHPLYSDTPLSSPQAAIDVMRREMAQFDREYLCVVNLNTKLKPINFNIVSVGELSQSIAAIPNIMKSGILSNSAALMLLHNHPSGDPTPSQEDLVTTRKVIEAGKLMGIPCMDHIVVGGNGRYCSMREENLVDFSNNTISMTAEEILRVSEPNTPYEGGNHKMADEMTRGAAPVQVPDFVQEAEAMLAKEAQGGQKRDEITIKFGRGLAEPFTSKDGKELMRISIPNQDPQDHTPWASFVLPAKAVHENQYGKGLWAKIPADGKTTVTKPTLTEQNNKVSWQDIRTEVPNTELKSMVEAYKTRTPQERKAEPRQSTREKLDSLVKDTASKVSVDKPKPKAKGGPEL